MNAHGEIKARNLGFFVDSLEHQPERQRYWTHTVHGIVAPYGFILTLERTNLTDALTFLMLEQAAQATRRLREAWLDITCQ